MASFTPATADELGDLLKHSPHIDNNVTKDTKVVESISAATTVLILLLLMWFLFLSAHFLMEVSRLLRRSTSTPHVVSPPHVVSLPINPFPHGGITIIKTIEQLEQFKALVMLQDSVAFDAEGVNLSRIGELTLMAFATPKHTFLLDPIHPTLKKEILATARILLESESLTKIIHDCRQDSDALASNHGIMLKNVFDTSIASMKLSLFGGTKRENLNTVLIKFGCPTNDARDKSKYKYNPAYWKTRPLTKEMIKCATQDVTDLFLLRERQMSKATPAIRMAIDVANISAPDEFRRCTFQEEIYVPASRRGCVIGKGGSGIRTIESITGVALTGFDDGFFLLAQSQAQLDAAKRMISSSY